MYSKFNISSSIPIRATHSVQNQAVSQTHFDVESCRRTRLIPDVAGQPVLSPPTPMLSRRFVTASVQHRFTARTSRISHSLCRNIYNHCPVSASNRPLQSLHQSPNIASLFRRLFGSLTGPPNPAIMSAAKQKAQGIIAEHPVGTFSFPFK